MVIRFSRGKVLCVEMKWAEICESGLVDVG